MTAHPALWPAAAVAIGALLSLLLLVRHLRRQSCEVPATDALWHGRDYACPQCCQPLQPGRVLLGKGAIWSPRHQRPPGAFAHLGMALPNTISLSLRPASNMAWRCPDCQLLLIDHSRLVKPDV
ncbi:PF20097 family protein [Thiobaca trueperi]|uniref:DUF6487 domain-containing protein n=1 Tax=Thiobaca trueperi TaxID=127458 RepID=A0A4R3N0H6_9GAMM|nr:PF20097 family protein [Thiobaca trueperi]TCT21511.1 hypothetical protein EDC35_104370 [Thiobaca trueperi]